MKEREKKRGKAPSVFPEQRKELREGGWMAEHWKRRPDRSSLHPEMTMLVGDLDL